MKEHDKASKDGFEGLLYPLEYISITATPYYSNHLVRGVSNSGLWDNGWYQQKVRKLFAPCTMRLVASYPTGTINAHTQMWVSVDKVWIPSSSEPVFVTMGFSHSDTLYYTQLGTIIEQGTHFLDTGIYGLYGDGYHTHMILGIGARSGMFPTGYCEYLQGNIWYSPTPPNTIADYFFITGEETLINTQGLTFNKFEGYVPPTPPTPTKKYLFYRRGDYVKIINYGRASSTGNLPIARGIGWKKQILRVFKNRPFPLQVGDIKTGVTIGFYKYDSVQLIK